MALTTDEVAGVADLFGGLTREQLRSALSELAFRQGEDLDAATIEGSIREAIAEYALVPVGEDPELLVAGPVAFPELPEGAEDLPHVLDAERRPVDRDRAASAAEAQFRGAVDAAVETNDVAELRRLLDVSYDLEAWGDVDVSDCRGRIDRYL